MIFSSKSSFPLLRILTDLGDTKAKKCFKEEIAKRYMSNYEPVKEYLLSCGYLHYLNKEELEIIGVSEETVKNISTIRDELRIRLSRHIFLRRKL